MRKQLLLFAIVFVSLASWCGCGGQQDVASTDSDQGDTPAVKTDGGAEANPPVKTDGAASPPVAPGGTAPNKPLAPMDTQSGGPLPGGDTNPAPQVIAPQDTGPKLDTSYVSADFVAAAVVHPQRAMRSKLAKTLLGTPELIEGDTLPAEAGMFANAALMMGTVAQSQSVEQVIALLAPGETVPSNALIVRFTNPAMMQFLVNDIKQRGEQRMHNGKPYFFQAAQIREVEQVEVPTEEAAQQVADYKSLYEGAEITTAKSADGAQTTITVRYVEEFQPGQPNSSYFPDNKTMVTSTEPLLKNMIDAKDVKSPLLDRLSALGTQHDLAAVAIVAPLREMAKATAQQREEELPAQTRDLVKALDAVDVVVVTGSLDADPLLTIHVDALDEARAQELQTQLQKLLQSGKDAYAGATGDAATRSPETAPLLEIGDKLVGGVAIRADGARIIATAPGIAGLDQLAAKLAPFRERTNRMSRLQKVHEAIQYRASLYGELPGNFRTEDGKPLLSWRVMVMSQIESEDFLEFNQEEAWDSAHNKPLVARMPKGYAPAAGGGMPGHTVYLSFQGKGTMLDGALHAPGDIEDGASDTIAVVEVSPEKGVPWSKPVDIDIDIDAPDLKALLGAPPSKDGYPALFFDGRVTVIPATTDIQVFKRLVRFNDGQPSGFEN
jgi:hypothetical protein